MGSSCPKRYIERFAIFSASGNILKNRMPSLFSSVYFFHIVFVIVGEMNFYATNSYSPVLAAEVDFMYNSDMNYLNFNIMVVCSAP